MKLVKEVAMGNEAIGVALNSQIIVVMMDWIRNQKKALLKGTRKSISRLRKPCVTKEGKGPNDYEQLYQDMDLHKNAGYGTAHIERS